MELRNLTTFMKVAELQNFSKAADELGYSQSAVTVQIRQLEQELGVRLFDRIGKNIVITQYGTEFMSYARAVLDAAARASAFASKKEELKGLVTVGTLESILTGVFSKVMPKFHVRYPQVETWIKDEAVEQLKESLEKNKVDLILTLDKSLADSRWVKLYEKKEEIVVVANPKHPLVKKSKVELEDLRKEDFVLMPPKSCYRDLFDEELARKGISVRPFLEMESTYNVIKLCRDQSYLSVLPRYAVQKWVESGELAIIDLIDCHMYEYLQLLHHKNKVITPQISGMLETILECLNQVD